MSLLIFLIFALPINGLEPFDNFKEGPCSAFASPAVKYSREFVDSLNYISAGSKYHRFRTISSLPNYSSIREDEYFYDFCSTRNSTTVSGPSMAPLYGFGTVINSWRSTPRDPAYAEYTSPNPTTSSEKIRLVVTLTDHKTFAFLTSCFEKADQSGWLVFAKSPEMDKRTERLIIQHSTALGFKPEYFQFLAYHSCRKGIIFSNCDNNQQTNFGHRGGYGVHGKGKLDRVNWQGWNGEGWAWNAIY